MGYEGLTGKVITPFDPGYERARQEWNRAINEYPIAIVYCCSNEDVRNAIRWSERNLVGIRIRSGGHNYEGYSTGMGKLVIDTSLMNAIEVDAEKDTVKVQAGTRLQRLYTEVYEKCYAFPGGTCPTVAISGLTLGGGIGLSSRYLGLTADSLVEAEMVDARGELLTAGMSCNPDLFWALRGAGGGNFGVVTSYKFELKKKVDKITLIQLEWTGRPAGLEFLSTWQDWIKNLDRRISVFGGIYKQGAYFNSFFYGEPGEAERIIRPFLDIPGISFRRIEYLPFIDAVNAIAEGYPEYEKFKDTGRFVFRYLSRSELENIVRILDEAPTEGESYFKVYSLGGAVRDTPVNRTAFFYRNASYIMAVSSDWKTDAEASIHKEWVAKGFAYIKDLTAGSYVNFPYNRLQDYENAYYGLYVKALESIKAKYDPRNVFNFQQSIRVC